MQRQPARKTARNGNGDGRGGETHQQAGNGVPALTTQQGMPVADDQNTLRVGPVGPALLEDSHFREKIFHFDHERIPERVVHARGYGAHGFFETYETLAPLTRADLFQRAGERTPAFVRFSTVAGNAGSPDLARDVRGFAVKLYTKEGNWDIVGNNIPVFFIQDAIKFPDLIHAAKQEPDRGFPQAQTAHDNFWDFISLMPESVHMALWIMSDRTIPRSLRFMEGFGVHTFRLVNAKGKSTFVKFHWKPKLGMQSVAWNEALKINGADPDFHRRDLWNAIQSGNFPEWELGLQIFDERFAEKFPFDVLDATKLIPEEDVPIRIVGRLVLDRCVDNFFAETEQVAFCTQNIVPGVDFSNDPLLAGRNFSYLDTQIKRLGSPNFSFLPINAPKCPFRTFQQDGHMAVGNRPGRVNYEPNSVPGEEGGPRETAAGFTSFPAYEEGEKRRARSETFADHYSQARQFFISQTPVEQRHIAAAFTFELSKVENPAIRERMVGHLLQVDEGLARSVASGLGLVRLPKPATPAVEPNRSLKPSPALSILRNPAETFAGRKVGVLVSAGAPAKVLSALRATIQKEGATLEVIAGAVAGAVADDGSMVAAQQQIAGAPSVVYDAVVLLFGTGPDPVTEMPSARDFVNDAYAHCKYIGFSPGAQSFVAKTLGDRPTDPALMALSSPADVKRFCEELRNLRFWDREMPNDVSPLPAPAAKANGAQRNGANVDVALATRRTRR